MLPFTFLYFCIFLKVNIFRLKFVVGQSGVELFISSDMFYLEIILDQTGAVKDVKVHHDTTKVIIITTFVKYY